MPTSTPAEAQPLRTIDEPFGNDPCTRLHDRNLHCTRCGMGATTAPSGGQLRLHRAAPSMKISSSPEPRTARTARSVGSFAFGFLKLAPRPAAKPADLAARCVDTALGLALARGLSGEKPPRLSRPDQPRLHRRNRRQAAHASRHPRQHQARLRILNHWQLVSPVAL